ncbi:DUF6712 family protein [uncultured Sanguibacteroides sp.]|uniref:DUF6712 family protein n=1 Tax=uncultured Sanguibacteroides sp. TaxID=1635151 RepID=UPI0025CC9ABF|nr:DUF6712 family protein [uncultured Sanguibacteroides sp.]
MDILFKSTGELRKHVSFLYATADFNNLLSDVEIATEELIEIVGDEIYKKVSKAYVDGESEGVYVGLIPFFQRAIGLLAYLSYAENTDVSHEESGRKVKLDKDSESLPWEWQIARDDAALRKKANKAIDRLISYLDKQIDSVPEWKDSEQRKDINSLFVKNAKEFNEVVPIDNSRVFYLRVLPMVKLEDRNLISYLGNDRYKSIKESIIQGEPEADDRKIVELCRQIIPLRVMAKAVKRFPVQVLPDGVVTKFTSERQTLKASTPATMEMIRFVSMSYEADAEALAVDLQGYIASRNPASSYKKKDTDYRREKFFSI